MSCACNQTKRVDTRVRLFQKKKRPPGICSQKSHAWMNKRPVFIHVFVHDKREVWFEIARHGQDSSDDRHGDPNCSTHTSRMRPDSPKLRHASTGNPHETPHDWTIPTQVESDVYPKSACYVSSILESVCSYEGTQSELPYWEIIRYSRTAIKSMILDPVVHSYYGIPQRVMRVKQWCPLCTAPIVCSSLLQCVAILLARSSWPTEDSGGACTQSSNFELLCLSSASSLFFFLSFVEWFVTYGGGVA